MQFRTIGLLLLGAMALPAAGTAQTTPAPPAITRTVIAATKLPTVTEVPLHFKAVRITLQPDTKSGVSAANGILYQMSGSTEVALDGEAKTLNAGEGLFIAGGKTAALTAGSGGPSTFLHFFLAPAVDLGRPVETAPAVVRELYRTPNPTASASVLFMFTCREISSCTAVLSDPDSASSLLLSLVVSLKLCSNVDPSTITGSLDDSPSMRSMTSPASDLVSTSSFRVR